MASKKQNMMAVSLRRGNYAPSMRFKPEISFKMAATNWRAGIDPPDYSTTMREGNKDIHKRQGPLKYEATMTTKTKNKSDKESIQGGYSYIPDQHYKTVAQAELTKSTHTHGYSKAKPGDGFDRQTANRTNYSLGSHSIEYKSANHALQLSHPEERSHRPEQPQLGGWNRGNGHYHQDIESMRTIQRGGAGAGGVLQLNFDIVTGADKPHVRADNLRRFGPRVSENVRQKQQDTGGVGGGFGRGPQGGGGGGGGGGVDLITGRPRAAAAAPPRPTAEGLRREDRPLLRTRPW